MSSLNQTAALAFVAVAACAGVPQSPAVRSPSLGVPMTDAELAAWDISIPPSGAGLPPGTGTARSGAAVYEQKCAACHGVKGVGKPADVLAGGQGTLGSKAPLRTVGSYWPYATTLFDYVRRAMPITNPLSLTNEEVYAVSAYILYLNGIVGEDAQMNAQTLPQVRMPNRDGFIDDWQPRAGNR
jgi:S-disulfanyl-L-cysteine oxidoreductase SoxD